MPTNHNGGALSTRTPGPDTPVQGTYTPSASLLNSRLMRKQSDPELVNAWMTGEITTKRASPQHVQRAGQRFGGRYTRPRYQKTPDRDKSRQRRGTLASTWPMPPTMCGQVTESQRAYARIITDEVHRTGDCRLTLDEIAARGGMCRKTAKRAQDRLAELGWIKVHQRPVQGRKHLANVVVVVSAEWATWIKMGPKRRPSSIGGHECPTTVNQSNHTDRLKRGERSQGAFEREQGARTEPPDRERRG